MKLSKIKIQPEIKTLQFVQNERTKDYGVIIDFYDYDRILYDATRNSWEFEKDYYPSYDFDYLIKCLKLFCGNNIEDYIIKTFHNTH